MAPFAGPVVTAGAAAYVNAKLNLYEDLKTIASFAAAEGYMSYKSWQNRLNLYYAFESKALSKPSSNRPFLLFQDKQWTYYEAYDQVLKYGTWLKLKHGVKKGDVVAMDFVNGPHFVFLWLALWSLGAVPAFINYNLSGDSLIHAVKTCGAKLLLIEDEISSHLSQDVTAALSGDMSSPDSSNDAIVILHPEAEADIQAMHGVREPNASRDGIQPEDMAILIFTSGTTGHPKAAVVAWDKVFRSAMVMTYILELKKTDRYYGPMPLYHTTAALLFFCCTLMAGNALIIGRSFSTKGFWEDVRKHNATLVQYVGETCRYLVAAPPQYDPATGENLDKKHNLRLAIGNGMRPDVWQKFRDRFGIETIVEFYGATESPVGLWAVSRNDLTAGCVGHNGRLAKLLMSFRIAIVEVNWDTEEPLRDPTNNNFCRRVKDGQPGEVLCAISEKSKFHGYYGNKQASDSKILFDVFKKGDAYFRSGDVMRWDSEGRWYFVDRIGDTFRWKSENVSTGEVAEAFGSIPQVVEANVYGVQIPNHDGRAGCAALQFDPELSETDVQNVIRDVSKHLSKNLQKNAIPIFLRVVASLYHTGTNKQVKSSLRKAGVNPRELKDDERLFWLRNGAYVPFSNKDWMDLNGFGKVKL